MQKLLASLGLTGLLLVGAAAHAKPPSPVPADAPAAEPAAPAIPMHQGPEKISLGHSITLDLPADDIFIDGPTAKPLLAKDGNFMGDNFLGMIVPKDPSQHWWTSVEYADEGYVKDDEKIDADELLKKMQEGTEANNEERKQKGFGPMFLDRFSEPPHYDKASHKLMWALELHVVEKEGPQSSTNFETRVLGRKGYVSETLICKPEELAAYKPAVDALLKNTSFDEGARYSNFDSKTDKVATYGLLGLIAGGAGAVLLKGGLFAKLFLLLAKGAKLIAVALVGAWAWLKKKLGGKSDAPRSTTTPPPSMVNTAGNAPNETTPAPHDAPSHDPGTDFK